MHGDFSMEHACVFELFLSHLLFMHAGSQERQHYEELCKAGPTGTSYLKHPLPFPVSYCGTEMSRCTYSTVPWGQETSNRLQLALDMASIPTLACKL